MNYKDKELELDELINFNREQNVTKHTKSLPVFQEFLDESNIQLTLEGFHQKGRPINNERVRAKLNIWLDEHEHYAKAPMMLKTADGFKNIVIEIEGELFDEKMETIANSIAYNSSKQKMYDRLWARMKELTEFTDLEIAGLQAFIWGVKHVVIKRRKSKYDMPFICIYSAKGWTQKTTFVKWLTKPLQLVTKNATENMFSDRFGKQEYLHNSSIVFIDELNGISNPKMIALIKMILTADFLHSRKMYSSSVEKISKMAHFIGTSQQRVRDLFKDYTGGNRRFLEIMVRDKLKPWLDAIGCIFKNQDYSDKGVALALWQSIDLNKEPALFNSETIKASWQKKMKTVYKARTLIEDWFYAQYNELINRQELKKKNSYSKKFRPKELIQDYIDWQKNNYMTVKKISPREFTGIIKRHLNEFFDWSTDGHNSFYWIDKLPTEYYLDDDDDTVSKKTKTKKIKKDDPDDVNWN